MAHDIWNSTRLSHDFRSQATAKTMRAAPADSPRRLKILFAVLPATVLAWWCSGGSGIAKDPASQARSMPEIIAHRGASYDAPENSLSSVNLAWKRRTDAVEIDVYLTRDGHIVAYHDRTTKRIGGRDKPVADQSLAELRQLDIGSWKDARYAGEKIPTLRQVLATVPAHKRLFIEVKAGPEIVPTLVEQIRDWPQHQESAVVIAFSLEVAKGVKEALPKIPVYWLIGFEQDKKTGRWRPELEDILKQAAACHFEGIDVNDTALLDADFVTAVHDAGLELYVWTVNDAARARQLAKFGVDGITTDRPGWLREQLRRP